MTTGISFLVLSQNDLISYQPEPDQADKYIHSSKVANLQATLGSGHRKDNRGFGKMIRSITRLPCKHEDLSLNSLYPQKSQAWWHMSVSGGWKGKGEAEMFVTLGLAGESS